jgi:hypothetical protein
MNNIYKDIENNVKILNLIKETINDITKLNNIAKERQLIGNAYQSLCNCDDCGGFVILDENKIGLYEYYMKNIKHVNV